MHQEILIWHIHMNIHKEPSFTRNSLDGSSCIKAGDDAHMRANILEISQIKLKDSLMWHTTPYKQCPINWTI